MKFVVETNLASMPAWWLLDDDHVVAWAGRTFLSLAHADQAAHDFRVDAGAPDYRIQAQARGWRWSAWRSGDTRVAVSARWFPDEQAAREAALLVQQRAGDALGP